MVKWTETDLAMTCYGFPRSLHKKLKIVAVVVMSAAVGTIIDSSEKNEFLFNLLLLVEHSLFLAFSIKYSPRGETFIESIRLYFVNNFDHVFAIVPYNIVSAIFVQVYLFEHFYSWET